MNIFVQELTKESIDPSPDLRPETLVVEDNVGEGIHIHFRNLRLEMSISDFETFADAMNDARVQLNHGDR